MIDIAGFQVEEKIYESVHSVVYRAKQIEGDRPVILKTLREEYPEPQEVLRYRREYETTHRLNDAGIPRPIGLERVHNRLILITEDIGGQDLKTLLKTHTFTLRQLLKIAADTVRVLGDIHAANLIHGDIKPSNIVFNPLTNHLQIIDFGSARTLSDAVPVGEIQMLAGTQSYMSPEQTGRMNRPIDWRTDFYSPGVALYELFTGKLPFETTDVLELVHAHIARRPRLPSELNAEVPGGLSEVIMKLLAKNPEDRYQSTRGIAADLNERLRRLEKTGRIKPFPMARQDVSDKFQISRKLVGRQKEIDILAAAYDRVNRGGKEMMLIAGPAGVGKTALVLEAGNGFARHQGLFLQAQFDAPDRNVPYAVIVAAFHDLVRQLLTESRERLTLWRERILAALATNGQVLLDLIPDALAIVGKQLPVMDLEPAAAQRRIKLVLLNFIRIFCRPEHPLVLFLDFLNLADPASLDLVQSLMVDDGIDFLLNCEFKFSHDRIHQAAYALVPESERSMLHYQIGKRLQQKAAPNEGEDHIFVVADQLNAGRAMLTNDSECMELAELNLSAGKRAKAAAVFALALRYFKIGLDLLAANCWQAHYDLALALHTQTAEGAFLSTNTKEMENVVGIVLQHARNPLDQAPVYEVKILALTAQNRWAEASRAALEILKNLGLNLPTAPGKWQIRLSRLKAKIVLASLLEKLLNITMENAGAQRGFLVLESGGQLLVEAEMSVDRQDATVRQSTPLESSHALSRSIVDYVARTLEPVVLDDAANEGKFTHTPYVLKIRPKSILCMPLTT